MNTNQTIRAAGLLLLPGLLFVAPLGCDVGEDNGDDNKDDPSIDEQAILDTLADYQANFELVNAAPLLSAHGIHVNVWVDSDHAAQYRLIDPDDPVSVEFAPGTIVVKEHLDNQMNVVGGTVMVKGPPGYDPSHADWWYAKGDLLGGSLAVSGPGLASCLGCHADVSGTDYLHGVAPANQN